MFSVEHGALLVADNHHTQDCQPSTAWLIIINHKKHDVVFAKTSRVRQQKSLGQKFVLQDDPLVRETLIPDILQECLNGLDTHLLDRHAGDAHFRR